MSTKNTYSKSEDKFSPVNVCFTSRSSGGAWQIRGVQIAMMRLNWQAINKPSNSDLENADLICCVKRPDYKIIDRAKKMGKPIVFDIVDSWAQPDDGLKYTDLQKARSLFEQIWMTIDADGYIFPTKTMNADLGTLVHNSSTIYHHYKPQILENPIREKVVNVGYEGGDYLGEWKSIIENACLSRGLVFTINPLNYFDLDLVVFARGGEHGNFLSRRYKSNVKLANAIGSGTPALVHFDEMSAQDTDTGDVLFFTNNPGSFERQLDKLINNPSLRIQIHKKFIEAAPRFHINNIANQFESFFQRVLERKNSHA